MNNDNDEESIGLINRLLDGLNQAGYIILCILLSLEFRFTRNIVEDFR